MRNILAAVVMLLASSCSNNATTFTLACKMEGTAVGKAEVRFPIDLIAKKVFWSTQSGDPKLVDVTGWTDTQIKGKFRIVDSYDLAINLTENTAVLNSISLYDKSTATSDGTCSRVAMTGNEQGLFATGKTEL
jgi:hypothetical protein